MSVASRVRRLLDCHGDSYARAEKRTGVGRETIRRIVNGQQPPRLLHYLRQLARGYGLDNLALLEGATPRGEFEWNVRNASPAQRLEWVLMELTERVKLTLDFLRSRYPEIIAPSILAAASGVTEQQLRTMLERWESHPPDRAAAVDVAEALHCLTGISRSWFYWGGLAPEWSSAKERVSRLYILAKTTATEVNPKAFLDLASSVWAPHT